jgi:hypothetical protein
VQVTAKDAKLDRVEAQMLDGYDNDKKVAVLARIQVTISSGSVHCWLPALLLPCVECNVLELLRPVKLPVRGCPCSTTHVGAAFPRM